MTLDTHLAKIEHLNLYPEPKLEWHARFNYWRLAQHWHEAGWLPQEARQWNQATKHLFMTPKRALEWKAKGFTPEEAAKWAVNWNPEMAAKRRRQGYTPRKYTVQPQRTR